MKIRTQFTGQPAQHRTPCCARTSCLNSLKTCKENLSAASAFSNQWVEAIVKTSVNPVNVVCTQPHP